MKVLDVYDKKVLEQIKIGNRTIIQIMDEFFKNFPKEYRNNYDKNLNGLELWKIDKHYEDIDVSTGEYWEGNNIILFTQKEALPHELLHLASFDADNKKFAYIKDYNGRLFEDSLIEGMTEYLRCMAMNEKDPFSYGLPVYTASSISYINGLIETFFIPNYDKFINLFPQKKDIISLMYSLNTFGTNIEYKGTNKILKECYRDVIDKIIDIRLSFPFSQKENDIYGDKLMVSLEENKLLEETMKNFFKGYSDYTYQEIKRRIRKR